MSETVTAAMRALARPEPPKRPLPPPTRGTPGGWRDTWDEPDPALVARAEMLARGERLEREVRRERERGEAERG